MIISWKIKAVSLGQYFLVYTGHDRIWLFKPTIKCHFGYCQISLWVNLDKFNSNLKYHK